MASAQIPSPGDPFGPAVGSNKTAVRDQLMTVRRRRPLLEVGEAARALTDQLLGWEPVQRATTLTCYVSIGKEPGTGVLMESLHERRVRLLLPVVEPDLDLDWAAFDGSLERARMGLLEPTGPRLGHDAVGWADVCLVPGLAADRRGMRLGRGGGCYDRALARVPVGTPTVVLLYDDELLESVPAEAHDRPVTHAATPSGIHRLG